MRSFVWCCLKTLGNWLIEAGSMWIAPPPPPLLDEPPPGHPERLAPTRPLTETERALGLQLPGWPRG
ncbi:DUF6059 family protein [Streptomyces sp. NPDC058459]|uniref:DUF6059 family protein n=1 Tax=Streptomyces sp. NPDC058459 TaxID=3346508 RepID=UPI00365FE1AC